MPEGKCLFAVAPYGVRDLLRAGDVPAMLAVGYISSKAHCSIVGLLRYFGPSVSSLFPGACITARTGWDMHDRLQLAPGELRMKRE